MKSSKKMKSRIVKDGRFLGGFVSKPLSDAVQRWVQSDPERDRSLFLRQAAREKLQRDGITFDERVPAETI